MADKERHEPIINTEDFPILRAIERALILEAIQQGKANIVDDIRKSWEEHDYHPPAEFLDRIREAMNAR